MTAEGMLESMKKNFFAEEEEAEDEEEDGLQFECALCVFKFDSPEELESHVKTHYNKEAADMEKRVEAAAAAAQGGASGVMKVEAPPISAAAAAAGAAATAKLRLTDNADRNWAAEFGYGKTTTSRPAGDLFLKMKSKFQLGGLADGDEEEGDDDDVTVVDTPAGGEPKKKAAESEDDGADESFKIFRARGFTGKVKASPKKVPRTLSNASLATRRRLETLIKRAREHQERNKTGTAAKASKSGAAKKKKKQEQQQAVTIAPSREKTVEKRPTRSSTRKVGARAATSVRAGNGGGGGGGGNSVDEDEGDEEEEEEDDDDSGTFDGFADEDEAILFPLENGWVMERTPRNGSSPSSSSFFTSFWSPEGRQFEDLEDIRSYCKAEKVALDVGVFERAVKRVAGKKGG